MPNVQSHISLNGPRYLQKSLLSLSLSFSSRSSSSVESFSVVVVPTDLSFSAFVAGFSLAPLALLLAHISLICSPTHRCRLGIPFSPCSWTQLSLRLLPLLALSSLSPPSSSYLIWLRTPTPPVPSVLIGRRRGGQGVQNRDAKADPCPTSGSVTSVVFLGHHVRRSPPGQCITGRDTWSTRMVTRNIRRRETMQLKFLSRLHGSGGPKKKLTDATGWPNG